MNCITRGFKTAAKLPSSAVSRGLANQSENALKTPLHDFHVKQGGKMVDFAGWMMPVLYKDQTIIQSHLHTRAHASIFDVSHMLQVKVQGKDQVKFIEGLVVGDIHALKESSGMLTVFTNQNGGILDDLIVTVTTEGYLYIVSNAGCRDGDLKLMQGHLSKCKSKGLDVDLEVIDQPLIALQGPSMQTILQSGVETDLSKLNFMTTVETSVFGVDACRITRCGYTGEDGVEISIPAGRELEVVEQLLSADQVKLAGLGARDSLRLEAGLCLYGNDIDINTTPVEAQLTWLIGKRRREAADFPGADVILAQIKNKPAVKRVGFLSRSGPPPRGGSVVKGDSGETIGRITSGCPSPTLKANVAMGYVENSQSKINTAVSIETRGKLYDAVISKMPFVPANYYFGLK